MGLISISDRVQSGNSSENYSISIGDGCAIRHSIEPENLPRTDLVHGKPAMLAAIRHKSVILDGQAIKGAKYNRLRDRLILQTNSIICVAGIRTALLSPAYRLQGNLSGT